MRRTWFSLVLLFVASAALAQPSANSADISVAIIADQTVDGNQTIHWQIDVTNNGPGVAHDVQVTGSSNPSSHDCIGLFTTIDPGTHALAPCSTPAPQQETDIVLTAKAETISVATPDPDLTNNVATKTIHATGGPDLSIFLNVPTITPTVPFDIGVSYANNSSMSAATGVVVTLGIRWRPRRLGAGQLHALGRWITCSLGTVPANQLPGIVAPNFVVTAVADEAARGKTLNSRATSEGTKRSSRSPTTTMPQAPRWSVPSTSPTPGSRSRTRWTR